MMFLAQNIIEDIFEGLSAFIDMLINDFQYLLSDPIGFLDHYFWSAPGYNLYNTFVYIFLIILLPIYLIGKLLIWANKTGHKLWEDEFIEIKMEKKFFLAILPYIFLGSVLRALQDIAVQDKILPLYTFMKDRVFVTPGVYILVMIVTLLFGVIAIFSSQEPLKNHQWFGDWRQTFFTMGFVLLCFFIIPILPLLNQPFYIFGGIVIISLNILFNIPLYLVHRKKPDKIDWLDIIPFIGQMLDAFATVISIEFYGYMEKHYLPSMLFQTPLGSWPFLIIKVVGVGLFVWGMKDLENEKYAELRKWLLWVIFLQGLATGTRDTLRLMTAT